MGLISRQWPVSSVEAFGEPGCPNTSGHTYTRTYADEEVAGAFRQRWISVLLRGHDEASLEGNRRSIVPGVEFEGLYFWHLVRGIWQLSLIGDTR